MIGSFEAVILDCSDPRAMARFYSELFGGEIVQYDDDRAEMVLPMDRPLMAFQRVDNYRPPKWPTQDIPQQSHIDVKVEDIEVAEAAVLELGATKVGADHPTFRVYLDPAGHPFCLITPFD
jgi:predicted enzyme related to lactoylglutathione lyase